MLIIIRNINIEIKKSNENADNIMNHANPSNADDNRSSEMEDVHAGWSQALKLLLRKLLMHESGPARGGIPFTVGGHACTVYVKVSDLPSGECSRSLRC